MQPRARGKYPAGEDAAHLALQRDLLNLDEGVGVLRLVRRPREAGARRQLQRAELYGLTDRHVEADDAAGDLVEAGELRRFVDDALHRRLGDDLIAWLRRCIERLPARPARGGTEIWCEIGGRSTGRWSQWCTRRRLERCSRRRWQWCAWRWLEPCSRRRWQRSRLNA